MLAGFWGGNLDKNNNNNCIGSTILLRVEASRALLSMGDVHAFMGDGEICGNGIEV